MKVKDKRRRNKNKSLGFLKNQETQWLRTFQFIHFKNDTKNIVRSKVLNREELEIFTRPVVLALLYCLTDNVN